MRFFNLFLILTIASVLFVMSPAFAESTGTLEIALKFTNGDSVGSNSAEIRIFQENDKNPAIPSKNVNFEVVVSAFSVVLRYFGDTWAAFWNS